MTHNLKFGEAVLALVFAFATHAGLFALAVG